MRGQSGKPVSKAARASLLLAAGRTLRPAGNGVAARVYNRVVWGGSIAAYRESAPEALASGTGPTEAGAKSLVELFAGRSQLLVYHVMFNSAIEGEGCPSCSFLADNFDGGIVQLNQRDVTMVCGSRAPLEKLQALRRRMGWSFPWVSSLAAISTSISASPSQMNSRPTAPTTTRLA